MGTPERAVLRGGNGEIGAGTARILQAAMLGNSMVQWIGSSDAAAKPYDFPPVVPLSPRVWCVGRAEKLRGLCLSSPRTVKTGRLRLGFLPLLRKVVSRTIQVISLVLLTIFAIYTDQRGPWKVYSALCQVLQDIGVTSRLVLCTCRMHLLITSFRC